ncbi:hypothetical protein TEQG_07752 [Trichophyton equinum CBS 127.97]|uniref:Uncharacterized protein n=1 Tax=Trichophyton equinum (strain ATCC MYA-4606 / CBS 127.97) TaxID=559882 RepID=F2Q3S7_TRIEC|nr:hypothetical protein TEQG_07752 [Trichophyton equinum CBS 127.97]
MQRAYQGLSWGKGGRIAGQLEHCSSWRRRRQGGLCVFELDEQSEKQRRRAGEEKEKKKKRGRGRLLYLGRSSIGSVAAFQIIINNLRGDEKILLPGRTVLGQGGGHPDGHGQTLGDPEKGQNPPAGDGEESEILSFLLGLLGFGKSLVHPGQ